MDGSVIKIHLHHQLQQDKIKDELLRINAELKQSLEIQKAKVRSSKETIKRLLIKVNHPLNIGSTHYSFSSPFKQSRMERKQAKEKCMENTLRIGQYKPIRCGERFKDEWVGLYIHAKHLRIQQISSLQIDGQEMEEIALKLKKIADERNEIQNATVHLRKKKTNPKEARK